MSIKIKQLLTIIVLQFLLYMSARIKYRILNQQKHV